jgi:hypothetical protein
MITSSKPSPNTIVLLVLEYAAPPSSFDLTAAQLAIIRRRTSFHNTSSPPYLKKSYFEKPPKLHRPFATATQEKDFLSRNITQLPQNDREIPKWKQM